MKQKNFNEIYNDIYSSVGPQIEEKRKKVFKKRIMAFLIALAILIFIYSIGLTRIVPLFIIIFVATIAGFIFVISKLGEEYKKEFKEKVISEIVSKSNPSFRYLYNKGLSSSEYSSSGFDYGWDRFYSEDYIEGKLEDGSDLRMSQVKTEREEQTTDSDGHTTTTYVTTFLGLYGIIKLQTPTRASFMIKENSTFSKFNKNRIEMESSEFEKYYDVFANSKDTSLRQNAMEIMTPEAIEDFVKIRNLFKKSINVSVNGSNIYFRIEVGDIFEPPTFKSSVNYDMLYKYFLIIDVPRMVYETFIDNILVMYGDSEAKEKRNIINNNEN